MKNKMTVALPTDREIVITRTFDAPRDVVWDTMSKPELLTKWLCGPPGWAMTVCTDDARTGGTCHWVWTGPGGVSMSMTGEYREVTPPVRAVRTEKFDMPGGPPMGEQLATLELAEHAEKTLMTLTILYPSKEARDGAVAHGMEHGMAAGYDRLDEFLVT